MPLYMTQARFTPEAWEAIYSGTPDRRQVVSDLLEEVGGRLIDYYFAFGDSDVVIISEAPDNVTVASAVVAIARSGTVTDIRTTVLMSYDEGVQAFRRSGGTAYAPPG